MSTLSIVIVSWNTKEILRDCLESVYKQTKNISFEVIVVDNDSSDHSADMVEQEFPQVKLIRSTSNIGFAAGNNLGFEHCEGEFVLLLNSDTLVLDNALEKTLRHIEASPDIGITSCKVLNLDHSLQPNCSMLPSNLNTLLQVTGLYKLLPKNRFFGRAEMTWWDYSDCRDVEVLKGCFMLVRSKALDEVGGMDANFFMYSEEVDWCKRFLKSGWRINFFPDAQIIHLGGASAAKMGADRARIKDASTLYYMKKHWTRAERSIGKLLMVLFYASRLPFATLLALFSTNEKYKKIRDNHWSGLTGLFQ